MLAYCVYIVMSFDIAKCHIAGEPSVKFCMKKITPDNWDDFASGGFWIRNIKRYMAKYPGKCEFFGLWTEEGNEPAGHIGVMYKGTKAMMFRLRETEAIVTRVFVAEKFRRKGCCEYMLGRVFQYLRDEKNLDKACIFVRKNNPPARNAYKKAGGVDISEYKTFRTGRFIFTNYSL